MAIKLLIAEDSLAMRKILVNTLEDAGYTDLVVANNGKEAVALAQKTEGLSAILLDWNMPKMSGIDALVAIKATPQLKDVPVIMVTSKSVKSDIVEAIKKGANSYIVKPFSAQLIINKLTEVL